MSNPFFVNPTLGLEGLPQMTADLGRTIGGAIQDHGQRGIEAQQAEEKSQIDDDFAEAVRNKDTNKMMEIASTNPRLQQFAKDQWKFASEQSERSAIVSLAKFVSAKEPEAKKAALAEGFDGLVSTGSPPEEIVELSQLYLESPDQADSMAEATLAALSPDTLRRLKPQQLADRRTMSERHSDRYEKIKASEGQEAADNWYNKFVLQGRGTLEERTDESIRGARGKKTAQTEVERRQGYIDSGVDAADSLTGLRRAKELMQNIKTGGMQSALQQAGEWFGIEGAADEGELRNLLSTNILQQLKPIFGAAFTKAEGDKLDTIMASFAKSKSTNVRLLDNAIKVAEKAVRRAARTAEKEGNEFELEEIKRAAPWVFESEKAPATKTISWGEM